MRKEPKDFTDSQVVSAGYYAYLQLRVQRLEQAIRPFVEFLNLHSDAELPASDCSIFPVTPLQLTDFIEARDTLHEVNLKDWR